MIGDLLLCGYWDAADERGRRAQLPAEEEGYSGLRGGGLGADHRGQHPGILAESQILPNLHCAVEHLYDVLHDCVVWVLNVTEACTGRKCSVVTGKRLLAGNVTVL